jgi:hypothetical protein
MDQFEGQALQEEAVSFISTLPEIFGDDLDRKTLWERIGNGIKTALSKSSGNTELFLNSIITYIKAEPGKVASNEGIGARIQTILKRPKEWQKAFLAEMEKKDFLILVKARNLWEQKKKEKKRC